MASMLIVKVNTSNPDVVLYKIGQERNCYLLVHEGESLLIDCCFDNVNEILKATDLPLPKKILHTQVQDEYCMEYKCLQNAEVYVFDKAREIALVSDEYVNDTHTVWGDKYEWDHRGQEKYGIAGCPTQRAPHKPLNVVETIEENELFVWHGLTFKLIPLDGVGKYSVGYYCKEMKIFFSGNLILNGGYLHNFYDVERGYGILNGYYTLLKSLDLVKIYNAKMLLPSSGDVIEQVNIDIEAFKTRINNLLNTKVSIEHDSSKIISAQVDKLEHLPNFREVSKGIFQCNQSGNMILFIDKKGNGIVVDPDHSQWDSIEQNFEAFVEYIDLFEKHYGLKRINYAFLTHYHGDHIRYSNYLRDRYNTNVITTKRVATVLKYPDGFCYPCMYPWYNQPMKTVEIDNILKKNEHINCKKIKVTALDLVGHCYAHAGFIVDFEGTRCVCVGDTIMYGGGSISASIPFTFNDTAFPKRDVINSLKILKKVKPQLVLCGHGFFFNNNNDEVFDKMIMANEKIKELTQQLIGDRDLEKAMTPPGFNEMRKLLK